MKPEARVKRCAAGQQFFYEKASQGHPHGGIPFFRNAVDVSLLSALLMDNMLSGAW